MGAALAFWIANPVLNPATLVFMGFVLGWGFTALRLVAGIVLVVGVSLVAQRIARPEQVPEVALDAVAEAYHEVGMRAVVAPMVADRTVYEAVPGLYDALPTPLQALSAQRGQYQQPTGLRSMVPGLLGSAFNN